MRGWIMSILVQYKFTIGCELGTYAGGTTFFLLDMLPDLTMHTVDIFERQENHEDYSKDKYDFTDSYPAFMEKAKKYGDRLIVHKGWTHEVAEKIDDGLFDFVFIDADHTYEGCKRDILSWNSKLKPGGFLMGHDCNLASVRKAVEDCCNWGAINNETLCWVGGI